MGAGFAAIVFGILFFFPVHNPVAFIVINGICYLGASGMQVLIWAMVNDAIDYHELQTGERNEGIVYSPSSASLQAPFPAACPALCWVPSATTLPQALCRPQAL